MYDFDQNLGSIIVLNEGQQICRSSQWKKESMYRDFTADLRFDLDLADGVGAGQRGDCEPQQADGER